MLARLFAGVTLGVGGGRLAPIVLDDRALGADAEAPLNRASCVPFGTTSLGEDDSRCEFPQSCLGGGMCVAGTPPNLEYFPEVRAGCLPPAGMCFVGDGCVAANTRPGGNAGCVACQPGSPWSLTPLPAGAFCDDLNPCTDEACSADGRCFAVCIPDRPGCTRHGCFDRR